MYGKAILGIMLAVAFVGLIFSFGKRPVALTLSANNGRAPLAVEITGPEDYLTRAAAAAATWTGCDIHVKWGDGIEQAHPKDVSECAGLSRHVYTSPGIYRIDVWIDGFGEVEAASWHGMGIVKVN